MLRGGLGVCVIIASAALGAVATIVGRVQPGLALGLFVLAGTVAAALTVEPRAGRLIFPVPALSYLIAALVSGVVYNRSRTTPSSRWAPPSGSPTGSSSWCWPPCWPSR